QQVAIHQVWLLDDEVEAASGQTGDRPPDKEAPGLIVVDAFTSRPPQQYDPADENRDDIGQPIPVDSEWTQSEENWVDVENQKGRGEHVKGPQRAGYHAISSSQRPALLAHLLLWGTSGSERPAHACLVRAIISSVVSSVFLRHYQRVVRR